MPGFACSCLPSSIDIVYNSKQAADGRVSYKIIMPIGTLGAEPCDVMLLHQVGLCQRITLPQDIYTPAVIERLVHVHVGCHSACTAIGEVQQNHLPLVLMVCEASTALAAPAGIGPTYNGGRQRMR